jgi:hypothetical protein
MSLIQSSARRSQASHRTYVDDRGGPFVPCRTVTDDELVAMAKQADRIEVRQAGPHKVPAADLSAILASLGALAWQHGGLVTNPTVLQRAIYRKVGDQRARLRLKWGRTLLAGVVGDTDAGRDERILLIVLVGRGITSCDWQLAF